MTSLLRPALLVVGLLAGCAATIPAELASARRAYDEAAAGPAATEVPAELHKAWQALADAEAANKASPNGYHALDLAYVAQRKAELAQVLATGALEDKRKAQADSLYQSTQDTIMRNTKAQLGVSQSDLAASKSAGAQTAAQLDVSEAARTKAEARAAESAAALARLAAVHEEARGLVITLSGSVLFRSAESALLPGAETRLSQVTAALLETGDRTLLVEGHTDAQGSNTYNLDLSQRRADSVRNYLISHGYDGSRVRAVGIGEARPIAENTTAEGRANNRRVEIIIEPVATAAR